MKKIVSLVTAILMIASVLTCFAGCAKTVSGTEAAKILLANERLDEKSVGQGLNIISTDTKLGAFEKGAPQMLKLSADDGFVELKTAHGVEIGSDYARWSGFETYSERKDDYMQFITPIDEKAAELASLIVYDLVTQQFAAGLHAFAADIHAGTGNQPCLANEIPPE